MGCGPLRRRQTACTNIPVNLRPKRPAFPTPSGPSGHLPRFAEKEAGGERAALRYPQFAMNVPLRRSIIA